MNNNNCVRACKKKYVCVCLVSEWVCDTQVGNARITQGKLI